MNVPLHVDLQVIGIKALWHMGGCKTALVEVSNELPLLHKRRARFAVIMVADDKTFDPWQPGEQPQSGTNISKNIGSAVCAGIPVLPNIHNTTAKVVKLFREQWPTSAEMYLNQGNVPEVGSWFKNPKLAETYERILEEAEAKSRDREEQIEAARKICYEGWVAETIDTFHSTQELLDPSGNKHKGVLRYDDLARWRATYDDPATVKYGGLDIADAKTVVVRSRGHFRSGVLPWFTPDCVFEADTGVLTSPVPERRQWHYLPRPVYPLD